MGKVMRHTLDASLNIRHNLSSSKGPKPLQLKLLTTYIPKTSAFTLAFSTSQRLRTTRASARTFFFFSSRRRHTRSLCDWSSDVCSSDLMTDEEGGVVQRIANLVGSTPSASHMGATMTPAQIEQLAFGLAQRMRADGVTMDLAPVLDVDGGQGPNNVDADGTRSFSANTATASNDGVAFATGLRNGGIVPVVKHFPGLGGTIGNTDVTTAATQSWSALQSVGLPPFEAAIAAHVPAVMVADATVPGLTNQPASVSPAVINGILRGRLGFQGLVITDSLSAVALSASGYTVPR